MRFRHLPYTENREQSKHSGKTLVFPSISSIYTISHSPKQSFFLWLNGRPAISAHQLVVESFLVIYCLFALGLVSVLSSTPLVQTFLF